MTQPTDPTDGTHAPSAIADRVGSLPEPSRKLVYLAAGLGQSFLRATLAVVAGRSRESVTADLRSAIHAGVVAADGDCFHFVVPVEAVYGLIPSGDLPALHLRVGRRLLAHDGEPRRAIEHIGRGA